MAEKRVVASLRETLDLLNAGEALADEMVTAFSDLDRTGIALLRERWAGTPVELREQLIGRAAELAEDHVDLHFEQLNLVALDDVESTVRGLAVEALWESTDWRVARMLTAMVRGDRDPDVRGAAATGLAAFVEMRELDQFDSVAGDAIVVALRAAASDEGEEVEVRARALGSLGARSLPWVEDLITEAYHDDHPRLRLGALTAMGASGDEAWLDYLRDELTSDDPGFRFEAVTACGRLGAEEGVELVVPLLDDEELEVARAAVMALGEIGGPVALRRLRAFAQRVPPGFEETLENAIEAAQLTV